MNYYISDLHFNHTNVIKFDNRPFKDVKEMEEVIVANWNQKVTSADTVYILGDFCWSKESEEWMRILNRLNGYKVLITGNHDLRNMKAELKKCFADIKPTKEIKDNGRHVIMSHYPSPFYRGNYNPDMYMLYGHVHITREHEYMEYIRKWIKETEEKEEIPEHIRNKCHFYNCWCGFYNYTPVTLEEIINFWEK